MMKKILNKKTMLGAIILVALVFRLNALSHGLENTPIPVYDSEATPINTALRMLENKNLDVSAGGNNYQPILTYFNAIIYGIIFSFELLLGIFKDLNEVKEFLILDRSNLVLISRIVVACLSTISVYGLYRAGKKIFGETIGLIAAILFSVELLHITTSHIATVWAPMLLFLILAFEQAIDVFRNRTCRAYFLSALFASLAFGTHLVGGIAITPLVAAHFLAQEKIVSKNALLSGKFILAILIFVVLIGFFTLLNPLPIFGELGNNYIMDETGFETAYDNYYEFFYYAFKFIFEYQPVLSLLATLGIIVLIFKKKIKELFLILTLPFLYYVYIDLIVFSYQARFFIIFIPFVMLLSAYFIYEFIQLFKIKNQIASKIFLFSAVLIFLLPSIYIVSRWSLIVRNKSTNEQFQNWIYENIAQNSKILINHTDGQFFIAQNREYLKFYKNTFGEDKLTQRQKFLLSASPIKYRSFAYFPLKINLVPKDKWKQIFKEHKFDYYIEIFQDNKAPIRELAPVLKNMELIKKFEPDYSPEVSQGNIITSLYHPFKVLTSINGYYGSTINIYGLKK